MEPFVIEKAKAGTPVVTRNGQKVIIEDFNRIFNGEKAIFGRIEGKTVEIWNQKGKIRSDEKADPMDLMLDTNNKTRKEPIKISERVFDVLVSLAGTVIEIIEDDKKKEKQYVIKNDPEWNKTCLDADEEDMLDTWVEKEQYLYQFVPDLVDHRYGQEICYEHAEGIDYPYFCPSLNENLYTFETKAKDERH